MKKQRMPKTLDAQQVMDLLKEQVMLDACAAAEYAHVGNASAERSRNSQNATLFFIAERIGLPHLELHKIAAAAYNNHAAMLRAKP